MKIFFDTEFVEDGKTIELLSIGLVREDGKKYYAEFIEGYQHWDSNPWVRKNVVPHLKAYKDSGWVPEYKTKKLIAQEIIEFVGPNPEFWAYYADYDWVALCQLYGTMMNLPEGWPMMCMDLKQFAFMYNIETLPAQKGNEHNALDDAIWNKEVHGFLTKERYFYENNSRC